MSEASSSPGLFNANFQICSQTLREQCIFLCQTVVKRDTTSVFSGSNNAKLFYEETSKLFQLGRTLRILCRSTVRLSTLASERQPFSLAAGPDTERDASLPLHMQLSGGLPGKEEKKSQACWNVRREQNHKKMEILQQPDLHLACT